LSGDPVRKDLHVNLILNHNHESLPGRAAVMTSASMVFETLFSGPNPGIVAVVLVLAILAAGAVFWSIRSLLVDARFDAVSDQLSGLSATGTLSDEIGDRSLFEG
jgi:hypothetical protein